MFWFFSKYNLYFCYYWSSYYTIDSPWIFVHEKINKTFIFFITKKMNIGLLEKSEIRETFKNLRPPKKNIHVENLTSKNILITTENGYLIIRDKNSDIIFQNESYKFETIIFENCK